MRSRTPDVSSALDTGDLLHRLLAQNSDAPQQPPLAGGEIRARMQRAAIIPHQDVARAPHVLVDEAWLLLMIKQCLQDRVAEWSSSETSPPIASSTAGSSMH